ncbi:AFL055Wp [Eremothecium gossypii ATCC 10895]|uniref:PAN2-PAN3 deadenylation complex catalytic subunit PAN2 n=1 Tax=Eremothecium gossypii (strain ATCC 10895 / CBS 109.51 / FGSC 9923 / NRRL Y-1056) TaxID=284811 RepID=PAN2_EREGS|nr:AFL055Wp [Eremothecium gossypii ATCC 10895]Q754X1.2 RecName: Full=PAN2-PAN3 deadenylation complex catalytic subunit PAN2; AltName: Full=PAB1P-dependent poly(A)-specific ribonuclease; AltName: Full=Poly(A)-nuclease deadenylation complex subunit 2; Short=PAN deadenylation complex subunit 2 [Eremothecium gossypii ATCC 10895]AAS53317.2 AFL055Wp [Eremothecium gossypii ATCC 10895]AEY97628.1 FAFL055Wp [Eremothecium gossypii FDAG1]
MNQWQLSYQSPVELTEHLRKSYWAYDAKEKSATKMAFDQDVNLIWVGDTYGRVSSYDPSYSLYTRHTAHIGAEPVVELLSHKQGVLSLGGESLNFANRRSVTKLHVTSADIAQLCDMRAMCYGSNSQNTVYCGGTNLASGLVAVDLVKGRLSNTVQYSSKVKLMQSSNRLMAVARQNGMLDLLDPNSNTVVKTFSGHSCMVSSMDFRDHTLVTAGKSKRFNMMYPDQFVNVYDLRIMKQLPPISFSKNTEYMGNGACYMVGADFVQLHPILPTVVVIGSVTGAFDFVDLSNPTVRTQYCHPCQSVTQLQLSPSGDYIAFIEHDNNINMWSRSNGMTGFTSTATTILEYPDYPDDGILAGATSIDDYSYPLSSVGLPYYNEKLLSAWHQTVFRSDGTIPMKVPLPPKSSAASSSHTALSTSSDSRPNTARSGNPSSGGQKYRLLPYDRHKYGHRNVAVPYRSLRERKKKLLITDEDGKDKQELMNYKPSNDREVPPAFTKLQMVYGRFGVQDFDFKAFNKTRYSGLETDIDNVYTNAVLQMYRFVPEVYNFLVSCLKMENFSDNSLLTELGSLYDMMVRANGEICRSSNFQEALASIPKSYLLGLITDSIDNALEPNTTVSGTSISDSDASGSSMTAKLESMVLGDDKTTISCHDNNDNSLTTPQKFNTFLLNRLLFEELQMKINTTQSIVLEELLGIDVQVTTRSISPCANFTRRSDIIPVLTVTSPISNNIKYVNKKLNNQTILPYIESSMSRLKHTKAMCEKCFKCETVESEKTVRNLPPLLSLNISLTSDEWATAKTVRGWLTKEFYATISKDRPILKLQPTDLKTTNAIFKYELNGYVARICDYITEPHLVAYSKIFDPTTRTYKWYMFNDFLVQEVDEEEALNISYWWKTPEIAIYSDAEELTKPFVPASFYTINYSILYRDHFANGMRESIKKEYRLLTAEEAPKPGSLVALDAEFVALSEDQVEISCKGTKTLIKPAKTALARVSVLRGEGDLAGVPFIDDYIVNTKHIEDYLTKYSGIEPGDLDPDTSSKPLVTRRVVLRKIWLLLQLGCIFVGHGLYNDFRNINIHVPKEQTRDTALYYLQGRRYLSLRYLAYALLDKDIQKGNHDSIEDAYTALVLYRKYLDLREKGIFETVLNRIYEEGRASNYRVPGDLQ